MTEPDYRTTARNFSANAENRIHNDEEAARFGFEGALVPGAAVFGHMTHPLVRALGPDWLSGWQVSVRFLRPAYDGDEMTVNHEIAGETHTVHCRARGIPLAQSHSRRLDPKGGPAALAEWARCGRLRFGASPIPGSRRIRPPCFRP